MPRTAAATARGCNTLRSNRLPGIPLTLLWHERMHADRAHAWVRAKLHERVVAQLRSSV